MPAVIEAPHRSSSGPSEANPSGSAMSFHSSVGYGASGAASTTRAPSSTRTSTARRKAARTDGSTGAQPRSSETATRSVDQPTGEVTAPSRSPSGSGQERSSYGEGPAMTDSARAASRTVRVSGPSTERVGQPRKPGRVGTSPAVGLCPTTPQNAAGMRMDPPPSVPSAIGVAPYATDAPAPPDEPPGVRSGAHGLRVRPKTSLSV